MYIYTFWQEKNALQIELPANHLVHQTTVVLLTRKINHVSFIMKEERTWAHHKEGHSSLQ